MKCDELKAYTIYEGDVGNYTEHVVYSKSEADEVIADLEEKHKMEVEQLLIEIVELKAKNAQAEDDVAFWKAKAKGEM